MKIVIIADTHMPKMAKKLPTRLVDELKNTDLILHAGDWQTLNLHEELMQYAPVEGVAGNIDSEDLQNFFGKKKIIKIGSYTIGLTHGDGKGKTTEKRALEMFKDEQIDLLIFGHSHIPIMKKVGNVTIFNPGSPTDKRRQKHYSFGVLSITKNIALDHIFFDDKS
ncbi:metallophosphoesterase family protein [Lederbergia wuyishanensis]|uniref:Phosphoesterase n=1 Tax=Lederbergia wuyishanensis TaxID=1347903 RepID=A0ABU0D7Z1_9BACI|nr:metallophosphoesterase family protein [Lederbergia wuyishanensis]MCJ8009330.1 metallophosphatase family protein [Lederbergia wuyishanensis]MDQ0344536.1 putative phosphoesterase [Lederbergia wuyishanensis]